MSFDLVLARYDEGGTNSPKAPGVLAELHRAAELALAPDAVSAVHDDGFEVELEMGSGSVNARHAVFQVAEFGKRDIRLIYDLARAGDMVLILEGGNPRVILTDPKQRPNLPRDWVGEQESTPVATSAAHLGRLMHKALAEPEAYRSRVAQSYDKHSSQPLNSAPWKSSNYRDRVVYVQARRRERPITQLNKYFKHYDSLYKAGGADLPRGGFLGGFGWIVQLPSAELFYGFATQGDHEGWMKTVRSFASAEARLVGWIEGEGERFVCDDGRSFPLTECACRPQTAED
jgi:hypothetical protein